MKRTIIMAITIVLLFTAAPLGISAQEVIITGTWKGTAEVPDAMELDQINMTIEKDDGEYYGTLSDSMGFAQEAELRDIELEDNELTFAFEIFDGQEYATIYANLTVEENKMSGYWEDGMGGFGEIELERE